MCAAQRVLCAGTDSQEYLRERCFLAPQTRRCLRAQRVRATSNEDREVIRLVRSSRRLTCRPAEQCAKKRSAEKWTALPRTLLRFGGMQFQHDKKATRKAKYSKHLLVRGAERRLCRICSYDAGASYTPRWVAHSPPVPSPRGLSTLRCFCE